LQRLFLRVKRREIDVEEAMLEAERLLGEEVLSAHAFMKHLADSLADVSRDPEQLVLPMELPAAIVDDSVGGNPTERATRAPVRKADISPAQQLKVEVWRDSRTGKRKVRITEL
jgi:hypothetical protein